MRHIEESALQRIAECHAEQIETVRAVRRGAPLEAEPVRRRARGRLEAQSRLAPGSVAMRTMVAPAERAKDKGGPEQIWGPSIDFVGVAFLERGMRAARTVGRVAYTDRSPQGTGFLIAPGLFLTNNHVLESEARCSEFAIEFDYEVDSDGRHREVSRFALAPEEFFITDDTDDLDYTVVAIGPKLEGPNEISFYGYTALSGAGNKHTLGEVANIVQHPDGRFKEVVLRENRLVSRLSHVLHYVADTEPGSSGSPVFNNQWQAVALHHWGGPWRQRRDPDGNLLPRYVNEGIRISAIVGELLDRRGELGAFQRARLEDALALGEETAGLPRTDDTVRSTPQQPGVELRPDGSALWRIPIEISVAVPGLSGAPGAAAKQARPAPTTARARGEAFKRELDERYHNRKGYQRDFIDGHDIKMRKLKNDEMEARAARNLKGGDGNRRFEFPYEHFSVYVDKKRRLPLVTACNIDGSKLKNISRKTGTVTNAESLAETNYAPEAREKWYEDPRIDPDECTNDDLYTDQRVSAGRDRTARIFHRGHMVRRLDPCWGRESVALRAEADTFHFTNCTPQIGRFNSRNAFWQGIENHILKNATKRDLKVTVFTGPVLNDATDPIYRNDDFPGFRVPMLFWKVAVWLEDGTLSALALLADQDPVIQEMPEFAESIGDTEPVERFVSTVEEIEQLTGLKFGKDVEGADLFEMVPEHAEQDDGDEGSLADAEERRGEGERRRFRAKRESPLVALVDAVAAAREEANHPATRGIRS